MDNYKTRSDDEAKTLELLDGFEATDDLYSTIFCVKKAIRAMWALQFTPERVNKVGSALGGLTELDAGNVQTVLTRMTRAKVLRSKVSRAGKRVYEVNF
jgi:hypothetical protein